MLYTTLRNIQKSGLSSDDVDNLIDDALNRAEYVRLGKKQKKKPEDTFVSMEFTKERCIDKKADERVNLVRIDDYWYGEVYADCGELGERWIHVTYPYRTKLFATITLCCKLLKRKFTKTLIVNNYNFNDDCDEDYGDDIEAYIPPVRVWLAMSEEQAKKEKRSVFIDPPISSCCRDVYMRLSDVDDALCISKEDEWMYTVLCIKKENLPAVMDFLFSGGERMYVDYKTVANQIEGNKIWIIGFDN